MKIYISGQITGIAYDKATELFAQAAAALQAKGFRVVNPLNNGLPAGAPWERHMVADIELLFGCEAIYLLANWEGSKGAKIERFIAQATGKQIFYQSPYETGNLL